MCVLTVVHVAATCCWSIPSLNVRTTCCAVLTHCEYSHISCLSCVLGVSIELLHVCHELAWLSCFVLLAVLDCMSHSRSTFVIMLMINSCNCVMTSVSVWLQSDDQGLLNSDPRNIAVPDTFINNIPTDIRGLTFSRTPQQLINMYSLGNPSGIGPFFPNGLVGAINSPVGYANMATGLEDFPATPADASQVNTPAALCAN